MKLFLVEFLLKPFSFFGLEKKSEKKNRDEREVRFRNNTVVPSPGLGSCFNGEWREIWNA